MKIQSERKEFKNIYSLSGNVSEQSEASEDFIGSISLEYTDWDKRRKSKVILAEILNKAKTINGIKVESREQQGGPGEGKPINIKLTSDSKKLLISEGIKLKVLFRSALFLKVIIPLAEKYEFKSSIFFASSKLPV